MSEKKWLLVERVACLLSIVAVISSICVNVRTLARIDAVEAKMPPPNLPPETSEPPLAAALPGEDKLFERLKDRIDKRIDERLGDASLKEPDDKLFARLKDRVDKRVEEKIVQGFEEAVNDDGPPKGIGLAIAGFVGVIVMKAIKAALMGLLISAIIALCWKYALWAAILWFVPTVIVAWIVCKLCRK